MNFCADGFGRVLSPDFPRISENWENCRKITDEFWGFLLISPPFYFPDRDMTLYRFWWVGGRPAMVIIIRKGRTWAIVVRRGSYKSLFLLNSGRLSPEKQGNSVLNSGSHEMVWIAMAQVLSPLISFSVFIVTCGTTVSRDAMKARMANNDQAEPGLLARLLHPLSSNAFLLAVA